MGDVQVIWVRVRGCSALGLLTAIDVLQHFDVPLRRHFAHLIPRGYRGRCLWRWVNDVALDGLGQLVDAVGLNVDEEVRVRWWTPVILRGLAEDLVAVLDDAHAIVVVFAPDLFLVVKNVDPVVAACGAAAVEEGSV